MGMFHMNLCSVPKHFKTKHIIIHVQVVLTFIMKPLLLCTHISRASVLLMNISHIQYTDHKKGGGVFKYLSNFSIVSILNSKHIIISISACELRHLETIRSIMHNNVDRMGNYYGRFFSQFSTSD